MVREGVKFCLSYWSYICFGDVNKHIKTLTRMPLTHKQHTQLEHARNKSRYLQWKHRNVMVTGGQDDSRDTLPSIELRDAALVVSSRMAVQNVSRIAVQNVKYMFSNLSKKSKKSVFLFLLVWLVQNRDTSLPISANWSMGLTHSQESCRTLACFSD